MLFFLIKKVIGYIIFIIYIYIYIFRNSETPLNGTLKLANTEIFRSTQQTKMILTNIGIYALSLPYHIVYSWSSLESLNRFIL